MKHRLPLLRVFAVALFAALGTLPAHAQSVSRLQVRMVTGAADLAAGSLVELRIYQANKNVLRLRLTHGEGWPRDSTRVIPVALVEPLDPRSVVRFSLYYRAASAFAPAWEVAAVDVDLSDGHPPPKLLLDTTLSGEIDKQGELATRGGRGERRGLPQRRRLRRSPQCNGHERCAPRSPGADARGCVRGTPLSCPVNQVCVEGRGCVGTSSLNAPAPK